MMTWGSNSSEHAEARSRWLGHSGEEPPYSQSLMYWCPLSSPPAPLSFAGRAVVTPHTWEVAFVFDWLTTELYPFRRVAL